MDDVEKMFPILWNLSDSLIVVDGVVKFQGTVSEVEEFKELLKKLDPTASRGIE